MKTLNEIQFTSECNSAYGRKEAVRIQTSLKPFNKWDILSFQIFGKFLFRRTIDKLGLHCKIDMSNLDTNFRTDSYRIFKRRWTVYLSGRSAADIPSKFFLYVLGQLSTISFQRTFARTMRYEGPFQSTSIWILQIYSGNASFHNYSQKVWMHDKIS